MHRLSISIPDVLYNRVVVMATQNKDSLSAVINQLMLLGIQQLEKPGQENTAIDEHCQQLTIQMNVLIKKMAEKLLELNAEDFVQLRQVSVQKYRELRGEGQTLG